MIVSFEYRNDTFQNIPFNWFLTHSQNKMYKYKHTGQDENDNLEGNNKNKLSLTFFRSIRLVLESYNCVVFDPVHSYLCLQTLPAQTPFLVHLLPSHAFC